MQAVPLKGNVEGTIFKQLPYLLFASLKVKRMSSALQGCLTPRGRWWRNGVMKPLPALLLPIWVWLVNWSEWDNFWFRRTYSGLCSDFVH